MRSPPSGAARAFLPFCLFATAAQSNGCTVSTNKSATTDAAAAEQDIPGFECWAERYSCAELADLTVPYCFATFTADAYWTYTRACNADGTDCPPAVDLGTVTVDGYAYICGDCPDEFSGASDRFFNGEICAYLGDLGTGHPPEPEDTGEDED